MLRQHHAEQRSWQSDLVFRYSHLFHVIKQGHTYVPGFLEVDDGWCDLVETAVGRIAGAIAAAPSSASVTVVQVKSKYGTLRRYWRGARLSKKAEHAIEDAVALAEARSACTCEVCGRAGVLHARGDWLVTACGDHARGKPVPVAGGFENLHIVRAFEAHHYPIASCSRYVRKTDSIVDVDPKSPGIEE
jgi:hypothetical protein